MSQINEYRLLNDNVRLEYLVDIYIKAFYPVIIE